MLANDYIINKYHVEKYKNPNAIITLYNLNREITEFSITNNQYFTTSCYDAGYCIDTYTKNSFHTRGNYENYTTFITKDIILKRTKDDLLWFINEVKKIKGVINVNLTLLNYKDDIKILNLYEELVEDHRKCMVIRLDIVITTDKVHKFLTYNITNDFSSELIKIENEILEFTNHKNYNKKLKEKYPIIFEKGVFGIVIHETVGHMLESDFNSNFLDKYFKKKIFSEKLTVIDSAENGMPIVMKYDDEGNIYSNSLLIKNGLINSKLSSNRFEDICNHKNARRQSFRNQPFPRMSNTYMVNGVKLACDLMRDIKYGVYVKNCYCGSVNPQTGDIIIMVNLAYMVINGKVAFRLNNLMIYDNVLDILSNIDEVGNDLTYNIGSCIKNGQNIIVSTGAPTVALKKTNIKEIM